LAFFASGWRYPGLTLRQDGIGIQEKSWLYI
jgi:hypothetical protein